LHGVDAPESAQSYGTAATRAARQYVGGKSVRVSIEEIGRYGRAVARTEVQGAGLGAMLIRRGLAWHYRQYAPGETEYARLQRQARNAGRGLWSQPNPTAPWEWRDRQGDSSSGPGETSTRDWGRLHETETVRTSTRNRKHSGSMRPVNRETCTVETATATEGRASRFPAGRSGQFPR